MAGFSGGTLVLAKLNDDGSLDESFGEEGKAIYEPPFDYNKLGAPAIQEDGKIIVFGSGIDYGGYDPTAWVIRFNSDGTYDESFYPQFFDYLEIGQEFAQSTPIAALIQPDGKYVFAGSGYNSGWSGFIKRYHATGMPDSTFGSNGYVEVTYDLDDHNFIYAISLLPDGKFIVGGHRITRLNEDGSTDTSFGTAGVADPGFRTASLAVLPDGKFLIAGNPDYVTKIARYHPNGDIDLSFGENGIATVQAGNAKRKIEKIIMLPSGKVVAVGGLTEPNETYYSPAKSTVLRLTQDGILDETFDGDGIAVADIRTDKTESTLCATLLPNKKILTGGYVFEQWYRSDFTLMRFLADENEVIIEEEEMDSVEVEVPIEETFIFPNPIIDEATLYFHFPKLEKASVHLYTLDGKFLYSFIEDKFMSAGQNIEQLVWPASVYSGNYLIVVASKYRQIGVQVFHKK